MSSICGLVQWIGNHDACSRVNQLSTCGIIRKVYKQSVHYNHKTGSFEDPEVLKYWKEKGVEYESHETASVRWLSIVPVRPCESSEKKLPALLVFHQEDCSDPYWAMRTLDDYSEYIDLVFQDGLILLFIVTSGVPDIDMMYISILMESIALFQVDMKQIYLDLSKVYASNHMLHEVPDFVYRDISGKAVTNPDEYVEHIGFANIPVINISNRWQNKDSAFFNLVMEERFSNAFYNRERLLHSATGRIMADASVLEREFDSAEDPGLQKHWENMGLRFEVHDKNGERWTSLVPGCACEEQDKKLPVVLLMQEVNSTNDHLAVSAFSYLYEYCKLAAQGEMILLYFVMECPDDNDLLYDILQDAAELYPIDKRRVYITGYSHNGHYAIEFACRHPKTIAAVAALGNFAGFPVPEESDDAVLRHDEKIELMSTFDIPVINLSGCCECGCMFPVNRDSQNMRPGQDHWQPLTFEDRAISWQRRLKASNCPGKTFEEIAAAADSPHNVTRILGIPNDRSETLYADGFEHYIADIKNNSGKYHLRIVGVENMPHAPTPFMQTLSWSFMRRFVRNIESGEIVELY